MATRSTIRTQVHAMLANHHQITSSDLNTILQADDSEILESYGWSRRNAWTKINTIAPASASVNVVRGTSLIHHTGIATGMSGRLLRVGSDPDFYRIGAVTAAGTANATLTDGEGTAIAYAGSGHTAARGNIFQHVYVVSSAAERVLRISHEIPLREMDMDFLVSLDPERITTADPPWAWSHYGRDSSGSLQVALFPLPSAQRGLVVEFLKRADLDDDTKSPLYRPDVLKWKSAQSAAAFLYSRSGDQVWLALIDKFGDFYDKALEAAKEDDLLKQSTPQTIGIPEATGLTSDEFLLDHDAGWRP